ncbi:MAG: Nif3-like dinuclear metal center hexameric protein [Fimbriimonadales bacterium]
MPTIGELLDALEVIAPVHLAMADDPIGLQIGRKSDKFSRCVVTLDITPEVLNWAKEKGAEAVVAHHPLFFNPPRDLAGDSLQVQCVRLAMANSIAITAAHTNWDTAPGGVNDTLARVLGLADIEAFGGDISVQDCKMVTFLPADGLDSVVDALARAGAGDIGLYKRCAFHSEGLGTFEPQEGANPIVGEVGKRETTPERRVEMRFPSHRRKAVEGALLSAHPYDRPAYDIWDVSTEAHSLPRIGSMSPTTFSEFVGHVDRSLGSSSRGFGHAGKVKRIAVVGGSGGRYWLSAKLAGADALVTGEVRHHEAVEAAETGICLVDSGHYHTEQPGMAEMRDRLGSQMPTANFLLFEPLPGHCGRP